MEHILTFAQTASPLAILAVVVLGLLYVVIKTYKGENLISKISNTQDEKYPIILDHVERFNEFDKRFNTLDAKLEKIASNHLHELPDMMKSITRIETQIMIMSDRQNQQGQDITILKTNHK